MRLFNLTTIFTTPGATRHTQTLFAKEFFMGCYRIVQQLCLSLALLLGTLNAHAELQLFFVHNDHLGTPKYLTDTTGKAVWQAKSTPFGEVTEVEDLDGDGKYVTLNMRFPGQYWDQETGTSYNYFRDFDPRLGRYVQSDPIGLKGGINTYGYVLGNPLRYIDRRGLANGDIWNPTDLDRWNTGDNSVYPETTNSQFKPTKFYGGEVHFLAGGGLTSVSCSDECGNEHTFRFLKVCGGAAVGISGGAGGVSGMKGKNCKSDAYKGWFFETGASLGYGSAGMDIGYNNDGPFGLPGSLSGVNEAGAGGGLGAKGKVSWCYYIPLD